MLEKVKISKMIMGFECFPNVKMSCDRIKKMFPISKVFTFLHISFIDFFAHIGT